MPHPPNPDDVPMLDAAYQAKTMADVGVNHIYFEWTCPSCGERVSTELPIDPESHRVGLHHHYTHTVKADNTFCGITVRTVDTKFAVIGITLID